MDEGVQLLELARNAQKLFEQQEPREKRRLLNFVLSNCTWEDGEVVANFRQPFDLLAETAVSAARAAAGDTAKRRNLRFGCPFKVARRAQSLSRSWKVNPIGHHPMRSLIHQEGERRREREAETRLQRWEQMRQRQ